MGDAAILVGNRDGGGVADEDDAADNPAENDDRVAPDEGDDKPSAPEVDGGKADDGGMSAPLDAAGAEDARAETDTGGNAMGASGCARNPCEHGGACSGNGDQYSCDCANTGSEGPHCEIDIDECAGTNVC